MTPLSLVTGAFSFTGRHIAEALLARGDGVRTLTRRFESDHALAGRLEWAALDFEPERLREALLGVDVVYNTYWIRFERGPTTFPRAVENTRRLIAAARSAGVRRFVHLSVTNADPGSPLPYFRGKGEVEDALRASGISHAIVRPTLVFGPRDILVNNIAWLLRRLPLFVVPGDGRYRVQPVSVDDTAAIALTAARREDDLVVDAAGPQTLTFDEVVHAVARAIGSRARVVHAGPALTRQLATLVGWARRDVLLTRHEQAGLMASLLVSNTAPLGTARFGDWLAEEGDRLGRQYVSELDRNFRSHAPL